MKLKDILNKEEELQLQKLLDNKNAMSALKKLFLQSIYYNGTLEKGVMPEPRRNFICQMLYSEDMSTEYAIDNERIGQKTRAVIEAIRLVEQSFREMELLKDNPAIEFEVKNPAR